MAARRGRFGAATLLGCQGRADCGSRPGLMESWSDDSWNCSDNRRNSGCSDTPVYHSSPLLLSAPGLLLLWGPPGPVRLQRLQRPGWMGRPSRPCACPPTPPRLTATAPPAPRTGTLLHPRGGGRAERGERLAYGPAHYENRALSLAMSAVRTPPLSARAPPDCYANTRAFSTEV
ncbi:hypothetical protein ANANG_G00132200 [Anguilla anguilla]|uniref:Uncharacterized protein n=1 Tax=Anguilla anguilla TaxID=7936 RepID=A0A9D3MI49_ANGAN|nr:hypothetical protein ANANG_G00132200 [Anguilla anguilla]